jgi:hypothetical protein
MSAIFDESTYFKLLNRDDEGCQFMINNIQLLSRLANTDKWSTRDYTLIKILLDKQKPALDYMFLATKALPSARYIAIITNIKYFPGIKFNHGPGSEQFTITGTAQVKFAISETEKDKKVSNIVPSDTQTKIEQMD